MVRSPWRVKIRNVGQIRQIAVPNLRLLDFAIVCPIFAQAVKLSGLLRSSQSLPTSGLQGENVVKRHIIVQGIGISLLLMWTFVWQQPASDAGGPPVRLAVVRQVGATRDQIAQPEDPATGLIPTTWDSSARLIPTEVQGTLIPVRTSLLRADSSGPSADGGVNQFLDSHLLVVPPTRSEPDSGFFTGVLTSRPLATVLPWTHSLTFAPRTKS